MDFEGGDRVEIVSSSWDRLRGTYGTIYCTSHETGPGVAYVSMDELDGKHYAMRVAQLRKLDPIEALAQLA
jgi:hypothetical protein